MKRTFVIADIHGACKALSQVLERSGFNNDEDTLIQLGDIVDGWDEVYECIELLLTIKNLISIKGNHDDWFYEFLETKIHPAKWTYGGVGTAKSYFKRVNKDDRIIPLKKGFSCALEPEDIPITHHNFFKNQKLYYIDELNRLFIHAGFNRHLLIELTHPFICYWDRDLWLSAMSFEAIDETLKSKYVFKNKNNFSEIFIGHSNTMNWNYETPAHAANIWNLDQGAGFEGKLSMMDVNTKEYWQSDTVMSLYPNQKPRH